MLRCVRTLWHSADKCLPRAQAKRCSPPLCLGAGLTCSRRPLTLSSIPPSPGGGDEGDREGSEPGLEEGTGQGHPRLAPTPPWPLPPRRRSLSPLERVSRLIPHQMLSQEVLQQLEQESGGYDAVSVPTGSPAAPGGSWHLGQEEDYGQGVTASQPEPPTEEVPFKIGDVVLVEFRRRRRLEMRKMFSLVAGGKLHSKWGTLSHQEVLGNLPGQVFKTSTGFEFLMRRPSLEEFVLLMKRGPAISYPKDISAMLMMMDVNSGDCVLESGSGSGAMTLFLSRIVGSSGHVYSFEVRPDHHSNAKRNYQRWRTAWEMAREKEWPNNVDFFNKDIASATDDIQGKMFDAIALDMLSPQVALPVTYTHLKQGGICAVYLANITQVVDLLEGIRSSQLSLSCEKILEVIHRNWLVAPALRKDGSMAPRVKPQRNVDDGFEGEEGRDATVLEDDGEEEDTRAFCTAPYIARPHHEQVSHSAFLVKLRKFRPAPLYSTRHNSGKNT
ncbi:tRNA (adenine(58)-N(1))-methyltransferase, mitochondrial-like isoform X1 [Mustelus asterias]